MKYYSNVFLIGFIFLSLYSCRGFKGHTHKNSHITHKTNDTISVNKINKDSLDEASFFEVKTNVGDTFEIKLLAYISSGKSWALIDSIPQIIFLDEKYMPADSNKFHLFTWQVFKYKANKKGDYVMKFDYKQQWDKKAKPDSIHVIKIFVN